MPSPFYHLEHLYVSNDTDRLSTLWSLTSQHEGCILVVGPTLEKLEAASHHEYINAYLRHLLKGMVKWCVQEKVIQEQYLIHDLQTLLQRDAFVPLAYKLEEYLAIQQQKNQCLRTALHPHNHVRKIHYDLAHIPFCGYITTSYDSCIENAYNETRPEQLHKLYQSSLAQAVDNYRKKQPFILKLYGDLDNPDSIKLGHRLLTGLHIKDVCEQLQQLFSKVPAIFLGFDEEDEDLSVLQNLVTSGYIVHQKDFTSVTEQVKQGNIVEISSRSKNALKTLQHNDISFAVHPPPPKTSTARQKVPSTSFTSSSPEQDSRQETQQASKRIIDVCIFYAPNDEKYKKGMEEVLNELKNKVGNPFEIKYMSWAMGESLGYTTDIKDPLMTKRLVILLISRSFLGSEYYNKEQIQKVVERHQKRAWISPILVRSCSWKGTQFDCLEEYILPTNKIPIASWRPPDKDEDEAYSNISQGLEKAFEYLAFC